MRSTLATRLSLFLLFAPLLPAGAEPVGLPLESVLRPDTLTAAQPTLASGLGGMVLPLLLTCGVAWLILQNPRVQQWLKQWVATPSPQGTPSLQTGLQRMIGAFTLPPQEASLPPFQTPPQPEASLFPILYRQPLDAQNPAAGQLLVLKVSESDCWLLHQPTQGACQHLGKLPKDHPFVAASLPPMETSVAIQPEAPSPIFSQPESLLVGQRPLQTETSHEAAADAFGSLPREALPAWLRSATLVQASGYPDEEA